MLPDGLLVEPLAIDQMGNLQGTMRPTAAGHPVLAGHVLDWLGTASQPLTTPAIGFGGSPVWVGSRRETVALRPTATSLNQSYSLRQSASQREPSFINSLTSGRFQSEQMWPSKARRTLGHPTLSSTR
jgi:hypothetical protein